MQDAHQIDDPPMPWEQYRNMMFREWARKAAIVIAVILFGCGVAAVIYATKWG